MSSGELSGMPLRKAWSLVWIVSLGLVFSSFSQSIPNWQAYNETTHGLDLQSSASLSFSAYKQNLWVTHIDRDTITKIDGYEAQAYPAPDRGDEIDFRVYESDSGQLWALHPDGVQSWEGTDWKRHVIGKVQQELKSMVLRRVRQIPLLPAEQNNVLILLSDQLSKYDSRHGESVVLLDAKTIGLGNFIDLIPASDGGIWITAEFGVVRIFDEFKRTDSFATSSVYRLPDDLGVKRLQSPFELDDGLAMMGDGVDGSRYLVQFGEDQWTVMELPNTKINRCWRTPDGRYWGLAVRGLYQWTDLSPEPVLMPFFEPDPFTDVAIVQSGAFFISVPNGVWRYSPSAWRRPVPVLGDRTPVSSITNTGDDGLWFVSEGRLVHVLDDQWESFMDDRLIELGAESPLQIVDAGEGDLILVGGDQLMLFDTDEHRFNPVPVGAATDLRAIGRYGDATILLRDGRNSLLDFDGNRLGPSQIMPLENNLGEWKSFLELDGESYLLGGDTGVARWHAGEWQSFAIATGDLFDGALTMTAFGSSNVWIGGFSGIQEFNGTSFLEISALGRDRERRAVLDRVNKIHRDEDGHMWVSAVNGVWVQRNGSWFRYSGEDGLPGSILTFCDSGNGVKWIGSSQGVFKYFTETDQDPPQTYLSDSPDGREISDEGRITFAFAGLDKWHSVPGRGLQYSWRFDDERWSLYSSDQNISWSAQTLGEGRHSFSVRAIDVHGNEDPFEAIARFDVVIPWWRVTRIRWVVGFAAFAVIVFGGLAVNRHLRLMRSYSEIEQIVDERTRQLERANRELAHSEKMRSLGTLAAGVAHDFNSILSIIRGSVQIIEANKDNEEKVQTRVDRIKSMVEQGSTLVKSMLGFSRADDTRLTLGDIGRVVEDSVQLLGDRLPNEVNVSVDSDSDLPPVHGNRELVQQIIVNLVLNAVDAMEGEGNLMLRCHHAHQLPESWVLPPNKAADYVIVTVEDTGCGISPENLSRIFEPFYTTKAFSTRHGTGLGLSMVYEFCKELGYGLNVRSELHRGASFNVVIPILANE